MRYSKASWCREEWRPFLQREEEEDLQYLERLGKTFFMVRLLSLGGRGEVDVSVDS